MRAGTPVRDEAGSSSLATTSIAAQTAAAFLIYLIDLQKWSPDEIICLLGNHEDMLLAAIESEENEARWLRNGGDQTLRSFRTSRAVGIPDKYQTWLRSLPMFY